MPAAKPITDEMVCFALYSAARATTQAYRSLLEPWGLTYPQYLVLVTLWVEGPQSVKDLGERDGLVERRRSDADARVVRVSPTARGDELRTELAHLPAAVARGLGLGDTVDGAQLLATLHGITASMHAVADDPSSVTGAR